MSQKYYIDRISELVYRIIGDFDPLKFDQYLSARNEKDEKLFEILKKYKWVVSPNWNSYLDDDIIEIANSHKSTAKELNDLFVGFIFDNDFKNLKTIIRHCNYRNKTRNNIIHDILQSIIILEKNKINSSNVVIPSLISQLEGIIDDYLYSLFSKRMDSITSKKENFKNLVGSVLNDKCDKLAIILLIDILFHNTTKNKKKIKIPFGLNRNKILHGNSTTYGKKVYLCRLIYLIDYYSGI